MHFISICKLGLKSVKNVTREGGGVRKEPKKVSRIIRMAPKKPVERPQRAEKLVKKN